MDLECDGFKITTSEIAWGYQFLLRLVYSDDGVIMLYLAIYNDPSSFLFSNSLYCYNYSIIPNPSNYWQFPLYYELTTCQNYLSLGGLAVPRDSFAKIYTAFEARIEEIIAE